MASVSRFMLKEKIMTENEEGTQTQVEGEAPAMPPPSAGEGQVLSLQGSVSKEDFERYKKELSDLRKQLSGLQGKTDKMESKFMSRLESLGIEITPELQDKLTVLELQDKVEVLYSQLEQQEPATPVVQNTPNFAPIIKRAGYDPGDPRMVELAAQYANDEIGFAIEAGKLSAATPSPGASATIPAGQGSPKRDHDLDSLQKDIEEYQNATNSGNLNRARTLRKQFRAKHGPAWDNINWEIQDRLPL
jgi:hypothetical protein